MQELIEDIKTIYGNNPSKRSLTINMVINSAKEKLEKEKQELMSAFNHGGVYNDSELTAEQYYNNKFK